MRGVLDTNVYVSALIKPAGLAGQILDRWQAGQFEIVLAEAILVELHDVRSRLRRRQAVVRSPEWIAALLVDLRRSAILVEPEPVRAVPDDPDDDVIVGVALAAGADAIITGDAHLLGLRSYRGIPILTPRGFLEALHAGALGAEARDARP